MFQSRTRTEPYPVHTGVYEYHLDVYMMAAPQVAVNQDKQPVWDRNQQPNIYAILACTGEDKSRGKKARITIKVVDKQNGKKEPVELDILRLHEYQHEPTTKPPILQARSQDLSWQVRWRTTLKPKVTEPDLYRRAQMVFLSSTELDDFISKISPLLTTRRLAATPAPVSAPPSSTKSSAPAPSAPPSSSSSTLSSSTSAASVRRMQTAFQPSTVQDDAPGSSSSSSSSGSGSSVSKSKGKSKRKELDVVDEETEDEETQAPSSETERKKEKESFKKKKKQKRDEVAPSLSGRVEEPPQPLPSTSPSTSIAAGGSRRNERSSSHSTTSPEGSFSPTPSRQRTEDPPPISNKGSSSNRAPKPSSSSNRSPGRSSSSRPPPPPPPSYPQHHHHHDPLHYRRSPSPSANPKSSPFRPQPVASTSSKPRSNPAPSNLLLSDLAGLDFGNGPSTGDPPNSSTIPKKGGGQTNGATDFFSLIDLASPLVSPLKASNVLLVHPAQTKEVALPPAVPAPPPASAPAASEGGAGKKRAVEEGRGGGGREVASSSSEDKKARLEDREKDGWEMDIAGLGKEELKDLMAEVMREEGFYELVERVDEISRKVTES